MACIPVITPAIIRCFHGELRDREKRAEPARYHAQRVLDIWQDNGIADWDLAFAFEALARAHAIAGETGKARHYTDRALAAVAGIADDEDRALVLADLETIPGQPRYW